MPEAEGVGPALRYTKDGAIAWIAADNPARMNALHGVDVAGYP